MVAVYVLLALVLLRVGLVMGGAALLIRRVRLCPACSEPTVPLLKPWLARLLPSYEWRWCPTCGWQGPSRKSPRRGPPEA